MNRLQDDDDKFETITDASGRRIRVARDGAVIHVPLMMMDSVQRAIASATLDARLRDLGDPRDKRFNLDEARRIRDAAYELRESEDTNAWRCSRRRASAAVSGSAPTRRPRSAWPAV
jgi:hypothetical protein